jgi:hypothetical protein
MRTAILVSATLSLFAATSLVGCSGADAGDVNARTTAQELKKNTDGSPTGNGTVCFWDSGYGVSVSPSGPDTPVGNKPGVSSTPASGGAAGEPCADPTIQPDPGTEVPPSGGDYESPMPLVDGDAVPTQTQYAIGATFPAPDGCNTCSCTAQGVLCTAKACSPGTTPPDDPTEPPAQGCVVDGKHYSNGAKVPSKDTCNTCSCFGGQVACTEMGCAPPEPESKPKGK